jgi:uncharacterized protein (TIGR00369 family)
MNQHELDKLKSFSLHLSWGLQSLQATEGRSNLIVHVSDEMMNPAGYMHGGIMYALCDVAAYSALLSVVDESETGVTHQINVQVMRPVSLGAELRFEGNVIRRGKSLAFIQAHAYASDKLVAMATVTKSMIKLS